MEPITLLKDKQIVLGVTGSIAAYKTLDLASKLTQAGAKVDVIMTEAAQQFVTALAFQTVTGRPVYTHLWQAAQGANSLPTHVAHIGLAENADIIAIIPATANTLAKLAAGMSNDFISIAVLAAACPILIAPAMDGNMYTHPATQANINTLVQRGAILIEPEVGRFASGLTGRGRLPETPSLLGAIRQTLAQKGALAGRKIVVSAGGTREAIDPVRFISNHSSGKQGYAIAQAAADAGAQVTLITTTHHLPTPYGVQAVAVSSAEAMQNAVLTHSADADALIMAAAVADFRPATIAEQKIKKTDDAHEMQLSLIRNPDILLSVKAQREQSGYPKVTVGFAAESENLLQNATDKLRRKGLDLLVANDITQPDAGFNVDTNRVILIEATGEQQTLPLSTKTHVAETLITRLADRYLP